MRRPAALPHLARRALAALLLVLCALPLQPASAQDAPAAAPAGAPTVCRIGVNVEDLYDLDMARDTFGAVLWVWSVCPSDAPAPLASITFPTSSSLSLGAIETEAMADGREYASRRVQGIFRFNWDMDDYPFDRQRVTIPMDESAYGAARLTFEPDDSGSFISDGVRERLDDWVVHDIELAASVTEDPSTFGLPDPEWSRYARLEAAIPLERANVVTFLKLTSGVFAGVFIAFLSFFYDANDRSGFGGKLGLLVGVMFAVLLSLRGADASLGDAGHLTLVTAIHLVTLAFIVILAIVALRDRRKVESGETVRHPDWPMLAVVGSLYVLIIGGMIIRAAAS